MSAPKSAAEPRPNDEPYYIDSDCPECGTPLELWDIVHETGDDPWHDEWACPGCKSGVYMDWPEPGSNLKARAGELVPL